MRQKSQEWDLKFSELSLKYKDLEARETALRALEQRLEEQEARQSSMSSDIAVREQRLQALSTRLVSRGDELESESRQWSVLTDRSSDVRRRTDDEFRSMHTSAMILHESAASDADTPLPAKRLPTASSHPTRSPTRPMSRIPDHPSSKHIRSALQSPGSSLTVDVIGNAASNVFRGIAVARRQSGELLNTVMSSLTSAPLQLQEVADTLQHEYLQLGKTLETHRSKLFELHADVQQLQDQLGSSSASDSSEIVSSLDLARAGLDSLLAELLIAQKQHEGLDDRLRFLAQSLSLPVTRRSGKAAVTVQHVGSSRDSSVAVSHDQHAVSGSAETATVDSAHDWLHTLGELGIPQTPRR